MLLKFIVEKELWYSSHDLQTAFEIAIISLLTLQTQIYGPPNKKIRWIGLARQSHSPLRYLRLLPQGLQTHRIPLSNFVKQFPTRKNGGYIFVFVGANFRIPIWVPCENKNNRPSSLTILFFVCFPQRRAHTKENRCHCSRCQEKNGQGWQKRGPFCNETKKVIRKRNRKDF